VQFKVDENLPAEVAEAVRELGHSADTVAEEGLSGAPDSRVIAAAEAERRILLTLDKGITGQLRNPASRHCGVVLFRSKSLGRGATLRFVTQHLEALINLPIEDRITVVTENGIRIR
jgi:predicted nuclease of predicted toxin-antitoxin system